MGKFTRNNLGLLPRNKMLVRLIFVHVFPGGNWSLKAL